MKRDLALRIAVAIITALVALAGLFHVALFKFVQIRFGAEWALIVLMVLLAWDAYALFRTLQAVGNAYVDSIGGGSDE